MQLLAGVKPDPLTIPMTKAAAIEGVVETPDGRPVAGAAVGLLERRYGPMVTLAKGLPVRTDREGRFLIEDIAPGTYYVRASATTPSGGGLPVPSRDGFRDVYYLQAADFGGAAPLVLPEGSRMPGLRLQLLPPESYTVSGRVSGHGDYASLSVQLWETAVPGNASLVDFNVFMNKNPRAGVAEDGQFRIEDVPPGFYSAMLLAGFNSVGSKVPIAITDRDIDNLVLSTSSGAALSGRIEGPEEHYQDGKLQVILEGAAAEGKITLTSAVSAAGTFAFENVRPARYRLTVYPAVDLAIHAIRIGGRLAEGPVFEFHGGSEDLVVSIGVGGAIGGMVEADGTRVDSMGGVVSAVRLPVDNILGIGMLHTARLQSDGSFALTRLSPGQYRVCGWREESSNLRSLLEAAQNERQLERACSRVEVTVDHRPEVRIRQVSISDFR